MSTPDLAITPAELRAWFASWGDLPLSGEKCPVKEFYWQVRGIAVGVCDLGCFFGAGTEFDPAYSPAWLTKLVVRIDGLASKIDPSGSGWHLTGRQCVALLDEVLAESVLSLQVHAMDVAMERIGVALGEGL